MKYAVPGEMKICGGVRDKCCTVVDEIKIQKFWKSRTHPLLQGNADNSIMFMRKIFEQFKHLGDLDPRFMTLKYIQNVEVPYKH